MAPLFNGTFHFVQLLFDNGSGTPVCVDDTDMAVAVQWATMATVAISNYASRFGPNSLTVSPTVLSWNVPPPPQSASPTTSTYYPDPPPGWLVSGPPANWLTYGNIDLWQWLDAVVTKYNLPASDCLVVLNPYTQNVNCSDLLVKQDGSGLYGIHGCINNPPRRPALKNPHYLFCFANVGTNFNVQDTTGQYAWQLSHELAEFTVDPNPGSNPEVCDPSAGHDFFAADGTYIQSSPQAKPAPAQYEFFIESPAVPAKQLCSIADRSGRLSLFYTGLDDVLYRFSELDPGDQTGSIRAALLGAPTDKAAHLAAGCNADGRLEVFYIGTDDVLRHNWQMATGATAGWSGQYLFTDSVLTAKQIAIGTNTDGRLEMFYIGKDDILYHAWQLAPGGGTGWSGGDLLTTAQNTAKQLAVASNADGRLEVFYIGMDDILYHVWQAKPVTGTAWSGGILLGGTAVKAQQLTVARNANNGP